MKYPKNGNDKQRPGNDILVTRFWATGQLTIKSVVPVERHGNASHAEFFSNSKSRYAVFFSYPSIDLPVRFNRFDIVSEMVI